MADDIMFTIRVKEMPGYRDLMSKAQSHISGAKCEAVGDDTRDVVELQASDLDKPLEYFESEIVPRVQEALAIELRNLREGYSLWKSLLAEEAGKYPIR